MSYLFQSRNRDNNKRGLKITILFFLFIIFIFLSNYIFSGYLDRMFISIGGPIWTGYSSVKNSFFTITSAFKSKKSLEDKIEDLTRKNEDIMARFSSYEAIRNENEELLEILGRKKKDDKFILARVLTIDNSSPYDTYIIDVGSLDGVSPGDIASASSTVVAEVVEVYEKYSKVKLLSASGKKFSILIGNSGLHKDILGKGSGNYEITVPREFDIKVGDPAILPGDMRHIVATVHSEEVNDIDALKKIFLKTPVNLSSLRFLEIRREFVSKE